MIPPLANNFVAGEELDEALSHATEQHRHGLGTIINLLGEHYTDPGPAHADTQVYVDAVERLSRLDGRVCLSVKPSQLGLDISDDFFRARLEEIVDAADGEQFVWIDMEDHETTDTTIDAYEDLSAASGGMVGVCIQANLKRTEDDLQRLADTAGKVRLVKGAYNEPSDIAYTEKSQVNEEYRRHLEYMFREFDDGIAVGSHDPEMIEYARDLHDTHGTPFEIQMLMGVREDAQRELAAEYDVWQYAPFGGKWFSYFYRRAMERKENALFAARAILGV
ncbi:proline dehydrogenase family protein [Halovivax cerinus]|uniref:proline dehydrogenase n=1 Tax=Halovivax cerinus TaxID=1487865 RepID=A0ABD5NQ15_9EURY|nr:proline dehydrogenase family protein [Halovivax cerinus]